MSIEAMQQALEALALFASDESPQGYEAIAAITALRERLAQPEDEPVAWMTEEDTNGVNVWLFKKTALKFTSTPIPLYTRPQPAAPVIDEAAAKRIATSLGWAPRKAWQGLTLEEIWDSTYGLTRIQKDDWVATDADLMEFAHIIEAKLKEKNCG